VENRHPLIMRVGFRTASFALICLLAISVRANAGGFPLDAREGDLIFREGTEAISIAVMTLDQSGFSHVGMLTRQRDAWMVVHATPSEHPGQPDGVVVDSLAFFIHPERAKRYAVYHVDAPDSARIRAVESALLRLGTPFRVADPAGTYCTLLMWDAWRDAGVDLKVDFQALSVPLLAGSYLLPGALQQSARLRLLQ
jgi:cell wall-associated NlpC family hydrolase